MSFSNTGTASRIADAPKYLPACGPGDVVNFYLTTGNGADLSAPPAVQAANHNGAADSALAGAATFAHPAQGVYYVSVTIPTTYAYCDECDVALGVSQGGVTQTVPVTIHLNALLGDAGGFATLTADEHNNQFPLDLLNTLISSGLCQPTTPGAALGASTLALTQLALTVLLTDPFVTNDTVLAAFMQALANSDLSANNMAALLADTQPAALQAGAQAALAADGITQAAEAKELAYVSGTEVNNPATGDVKIENPAGQTVTEFTDTYDSAGQLTERAEVQ